MKIYEILKAAIDLAALIITFVQAKKQSKK